MTCLFWQKLTENVDEQAKNLVSETISFPGYVQGRNKYGDRPFLSSGIFDRTAKCRNRHVSQNPISSLAYGNLVIFTIFFANAMILYCQ